MGFQAYVALGDSMSIDRYPELDYVERRRPAAAVPHLGAASLLARNQDRVWPEFSGRDLAAASPGLACRVLAADGATTESVLHEQLQTLRALPGAAETLVTLTAGGNDLLGLIGASEPAGHAGVQAALRHLGEIVARVRRALPRAVVLVANVYDPTDGSGSLEGTRLRPQELRWLGEFNDGVAGLCRERDTRLVDLHRHFAGHGVSAPAERRWYWTGSLIEPGFVGASEIRRLWLAALAGPRG
jgi:lysophospholipase L1-like esterase